MVKKYGGTKWSGAIMLGPLEINGVALPSWWILRTVASVVAMRAIMATWLLTLFRPTFLQEASPHHLCCTRAKQCPCDLGCMFTNPKKKRTFQLFLRKISSTKQHLNRISLYSIANLCEVPSCNGHSIAWPDHLSIKRICPEYLA